MHVGRRPTYAECDTRGGAINGWSGSLASQANQPFGPPAAPSERILLKKESKGVAWRNYSPSGMGPLSPDGPLCFYQRGCAPLLDSQAFLGPERLILRLPVPAGSLARPIHSRSGHRLKACLQGPIRALRLVRP